MKDLYNAQYYLEPLRLMYMENPVRFLSYASFIIAERYKKILDVGCGKNVLAKYLRQLGVDAVGVDFSPHSNADIIADATALPFRDGCFDLVVTTDFMEHIPRDRLDVTIEEFKRVGGEQAHFICFDSMHGASDDKYHMTLRPQLWWINLFSTLGLKYTMSYECSWCVSKTVFNISAHDGSFLMFFA